MNGIHRAVGAGANVNILEGDGMYRVEYGGDTVVRR